MSNEKSLQDRLEKQRELLDKARNPDQTPFDYIVVGSGAGGGPLAARLALTGNRVLVLEAGCDPAPDAAAGGNPLSNPAVCDETAWRDVYQVPGYHGSATEDEQISWEFSVRHYAELDRQKKDLKYQQDHDRDGKGGIQYPRCAALGGCTSHYAMIVVRPNDCDWDRIARITGDDSWRASTMQGYFTLIEKCLYNSVYQGFFAGILGPLFTVTRKILTFLNPRLQLDQGGHGSYGWQTTSFISPLLIRSIAKGDSTFRRVLLKTVLSLLRRPELKARLKRALVQFRLVRHFDPNDLNKRRNEPDGIIFIPTGTDGKRRAGLREWLLETSKTNYENLVIETGAFATRVLFAKGEDAPRAHGVELAAGLHLYGASPRFVQSSGARKHYFARKEVIVCGGAFNSPQLLMLSGIGETQHLKDKGIDGLYAADGSKVDDVVHLPGVGKNLQDRYEVSVISEVEQDFSTLKGISFAPGDNDDPARGEWRKSQQGLYATNGGALAFLLNSGATLDLTDPEAPIVRKEPDLFIFGFPAAFRGYYWGWSKELLKPSQGAAAEQRNLWSWVILKAYTSNSGGEVRLKSSVPFEQAEINLHSFDEGPAGHHNDVQALLNGIKTVRDLNQTRGNAFRKELQPGQQLADDSDDLRNWIRDEAWGHHACGTCRIGRDSWQANTLTLKDKGAVVDSRFRVHGVKGLRVVDASIFHDIPGYFICAAVFMIGEKAADTLIADSQDYPLALETAEAEAINRRRQSAYVPDGGKSCPGDQPSPKGRLPGDAVGLALSGGGIRSATLSLGVLQALAAKNRLRCIDMLSTVSGGGYIGTFLGRLFTRIDKNEPDKAGRVQEVISDINSAPIGWLRRYAQYIAPSGRPDWHTDLGIFWRNLVAVYLCLGTLILGVFGLARWVAECATKYLHVAYPQLEIPGLGNVIVSPWWWVPLLVLIVLVVPGALSFWLTPKGGTSGRYPLFTLLGWAVLVAGAAAAFRIPAAWPWAALGLVILLLAWAWQEVLRWWPPDGMNEESRSAVVRNRVTRYTGRALLALLFATLWFVLDTAALTVARNGVEAKMVGGIGGAVAVLLPLLRRAVTWLTRTGKTAQAKTKELVPKDLMLTAMTALVAFPLVAILLFGLDVLAHLVFYASPAVGAYVVVLTLLFSLVVGRAFEVLNRSSLQSAYAERLARTFLGASNEERTDLPSGASSPDVQLSHPKDDLPFHDYHPENSGGPLHLINVCVNETADAGSGRRLPEDKGLSMCVGPEGVSVGRRYHALWRPVETDMGRRVRDRIEDPRPTDAGRKVALKALPAAPDPNAFHVFGRQDRMAAAVESLRLSQWLGISAAAFTTGLGRNSRISLSLLLGLVNLRLGYWWDTDIRADQRPGRYPPGPWRRLKSLPSWVFKMQSKLLDEWRAYFAGPSDQYWYLSDGGHFENTALYELVRRRLPFMICVDAGEDASYEFGDLALLTRLTRLDFGAEFEWVNPGADSTQKRDWPAIEAAAGTPVPDWIQQWLNPAALGSLQDIKRDGPGFAALARVTYRDNPAATSWLLLLKASVTGTLPVDVRFYTAQNKEFPQQSTVDQFFDDAQWESYRSLGLELGRRVFR